MVFPLGPPFGEEAEDEGEDKEVKRVEGEEKGAAVSVSISFPCCFWWSCPSLESGTVMVTMGVVTSFFSFSTTAGSDVSRWRGGADFSASFFIVSGGEEEEGSKRE